MNKVYLCLGTNLGNREQHLQDAIHKINIQIGKVTAKSSILDTLPWGVENQENYLNQVLRVESDLTPLQLLESIHQIERELGRIRHQKWEARIIDIDIIFYNDEIIQLANLQIPHPLMHQREFVLVPLCEIAPLLIHPFLQKTIKDLVAELKSK